MTGTTMHSFLAFFFCRPPNESPALSGASSSSLFSLPAEYLPDFRDASVRLSSATWFLISFSFLAEPPEHTSETLRPRPHFACRRLLYQLLSICPLWRVAPNPSKTRSRLYHLACGCHCVCQPVPDHHRECVSGHPTIRAIGTSS
jgi:hypothetical protein